MSILDSVDEIVEDIHRDLPDVEWKGITPSTTDIFHGVNATAFSGTGRRWAHNLIVWSENGVEKCDGSVVNLRTPLIIRYTPELAAEALKLVKEGMTHG